MILGMRTSVSTLAISPVVSQNFLTNTTVPSWLDNSGTTGNRMLYDATGKLTYAPNNMATSSQDFSTVAWTKTGLLAFGSGSTQNTNATNDPFGANNAALITEDTSAGRHFVYRNLSAAIGTKYVASIYAKAATRTFVALGQRNGAGTVGYTVVVNLSNGTISTTSSVGAPTGTSSSVDPIGNGWYRISVGMIADASSLFFECGVSNSGTPTYFANMPTYTGDGSSGLYVYGGQLEAVTYQTAPTAYIPTTTAAVYQPRFDYDPATLQPRGLLIEESMANIALQSNTLTTTWTLSGVSLAQNVTGVDGLTSAWTVTNDTTNVIHQFYQSVASASGRSHQVVAKAGTASFMTITPTGIGSCYATFDLSNGSVVASAGGTASAVAIGNGFYLCKLENTTVAGTFYILRIAETAAQAVSMLGGTGYVGTNKTIIVQNLQLEVGAFCTSYIPTVAASVTRVADIVKWTSAAFSSYWNATQGSVITQVATTTVKASAGVFSANSGTSANRIDCRADGASIVTAASVNQAVLNFGAFSNDTTNRVGVAYKLNDFAAVKNNGTVVTDTSGTVPTVSQFQIGGLDGGSANGLNGWVQSLAYYNQRLPDATLKTKSTVGAPL